MLSFDIFSQNSSNLIYVCANALSFTLIFCTSLFIYLGFYCMNFLFLENILMIIDINHNALGQILYCYLLTATVFNLAFNVVGALIFFLPLSIFKTQIVNFFSLFSNGVERAIANFHTLFNLLVTLILLPVLKPFTNLIEKLVTTKTSPKKTKSHLKVKIKRVKTA